MRPSLRNTSLSFAGLILAVGVLVACQSTGSPDPESKGPMVAYATFQITTRDSSRLPDSIEWTAGKQSGKGRFTCVDFSCTDTLALSDALGSDTARLRLYKLGLKIATFAYVQIGRASILTATSNSSRIDANLKLLSSFYELRRSNVDSFQKIGSPTSAQLAAYYATLVFTKTAGYTRFPDSIPVGMSVDSVRKNLVRIAATAKSSWSQIALSKWGLDSVAIHAISMDLFRAGQISFTDTMALFPMPPVRVFKEIRIDSVLVVGGSLKNVTGTFVADRGVINLLVQVFRDSVDVTAAFEFNNTAQTNTKPKNLELGQNLSMRAADTTMPGWYRLRILASDDSGRHAASEIAFRVASKPDVTGPKLEWRSPKSTRIFNFVDSVLLVEVAASDTSGVDSVFVNGTKADLLEGSYAVKVTIPTSEKGLVVSVRAVDRQKNVAADSIVVFRKTFVPIAPPTAVRVAPESKSNIVVPFDSASVFVAWKIVDAVSGVDDTSPRIGGIKASKQNDSIWGRNVELASTGVPTIITLEARNKAGLAVSDFVSVTREKDTLLPKVEIVAGSRTVPNDSTKASVAWIVADNDSVASVKLSEAIVGKMQGVYSVEKSLHLGANLFALEAVDVAGNVTKDTVVIDRNAAVPKHVLSSPNQIAPVFDTLKFESDEADSVETSLDSVSWSKYRTPIPLTSGATVFTRSFPGGVAGRFVSPTFFSKVTGIPSTASPSSSFFLKNDSLWVVGNDTAGQLGDGATSNRSVPKMVMTGVVKVASGQAHTLFLKSNGSLWVVGKNDDGQLGLGSRVNQSEPVQAVESDVVDIAAGDNSSYILRWGSVYASGRNSVGQLGMDATAYGMPRFVATTSTGDLQGKVAKIFAGGASASLITADGGLYSVGDNKYGQLGIASADSSTSVWTKVAVSGAKAVSMTSTATFIVGNSGELLAAGKNTEDRFGVGDSAMQHISFAMIAVGVSQASASNTNLAYLAGGLLYGSGSNRSGQLGDGVLPKLGRMTQLAENVSGVSVGANFIAFLKQDGSLWGIGASESGQLGSMESSAKARQIKF